VNRAARLSSSSALPDYGKGIGIISGAVFAIEKPEAPLIILAE